MSVEQIRLVLQLNLRIRNTDLLLKHFSKTGLLTESEINKLEKRMLFCITSAKEIIISIVKDRKVLGEEWENIKSKLL